MALGRMMRAGSAVVAATAAAGAMTVGFAGSAAAAGKLRAVTPQRADRAAIAWVKAHHPGACRARVLQTEADVERGRAVFDVRTAAPNGTVYVVQVARSNAHVLWVNKAESQTGGCRR